MLDAIRGILYEKPLTIQQRVVRWTLTLQREKRRLELLIRGIESEELQVQRQADLEAKRTSTHKQPQAEATLRAALVKSQKHRARLQSTCSLLDSTVGNLRVQAAMSSAVLHLKSSASMLGAINKLCKVKELHGVAATMRSEMNKAGLIAEQLDSVMQPAEAEEEEEEAAAAAITNAAECQAIDDVLNELQVPQAAAANAKQEETKEDEAELEQRIQKLKDTPLLVHA